MTTFISGALILPAPFCYKNFVVTLGKIQSDMDLSIDIPEIPNLIHYAIPFFIATLIIEVILSSKRRLGSYTLKDSAASIAMGLGNVALGFLSKAMVLYLLTLVYMKFRVFTIPFSWWAWILILLFEDFCYYWFHRISHENRFFWASHVVHHSSKKYNLSTALRQTWSGSFLSFVFWLPLAVLGFHPVMILAQMSISLLYQYWIHTELIRKLPSWFEAIFNTPSHHRVHHATNPQYLDRNHAGIFIIWDKIFGTFEPEVEKPVYGLVKNINTYNPLKIAFMEWYYMFRDAYSAKTSIGNKIKYFVKPPGWRHDNKGLVSADLREEWLKNADDH